MNRYLVMQAYGHEEALRSCLLALLSLSKFHSPEECPEVWIYTDNADWFTQWNCPLPLRFRTLDAATIKAWRGAIDFVHRVKIEVLRDFSASREDAAVLYVDTDVLFLQSLNPILQRIGEGELFMHVSEGRLGETGSPMMVKLHRFLQKASLPQEFAAPMNAVMWNAGVLGFHTCYKGILDNVLHYTDTIHPLFPKHVVEQFAFSIFFQKAEQVHNAFSSILHYWIIKEHRDIMASFFTHYRRCPWNELVRLSALIQIPELIQQKTSFFINRSMAGKVRQLKWVPVVPDWEELERQL